MMIAYLFFYSTVIFQAFLNAVFHINWITKTRSVPRLLSCAYIFAFIWYICSICYFIEKAHFLSFFNLEVLDYLSVLSIAGSLIFATYFILMIKPVQVPLSDDKEHYYFAFPIHLLMYIGLIISTSIFNFILGLFIN
jgi:hypothetical protein